MKLLETKNLSLTIQEKKIFENVNLSIKKGHIHALIGTNGCGKTSIANVIMGVEHPTEGKIFLEGQDITEESITERAKKGLTLAFQEPARFEGISVKEYLAITNENITQTAVEQALESVGLLPSRYINRNVDETLSGGERKRIELASILLMQPKLAIFDEIDSGVDFIGIDQVLNSIRAIAKEGAVLLITHQDEFLKIADKATLVCNGTVLRTGEPQEISKFYRYECTFCTDQTEPDLALEGMLHGS